MAGNPETQYPGKITPSSGNYPYGEARDVTVPGDGTGTPWVAPLLNDIFGFQQALLFDLGVVPSGSPDTAIASQYLAAVKGINAAPVNDILALVSVISGERKFAAVLGFFVTFPQSEFFGGGLFAWQAGLAKSNANGGTIIDPDNIGGFDGTQATLAAFFAAQSGGGGNGCWVRVEGNGVIDVTWFGARNGVDDTDAFDAARQVSNHLRVPNGAYSIDFFGSSTAIVDDFSFIGEGQDTIITLTGDDADARSYTNTGTTITANFMAVIGGTNTQAEISNFQLVGNANVTYGAAAVSAFDGSKLFDDVVVKDFTKAGAVPITFYNCLSGTCSRLKGNNVYSLARVMGNCDAFRFLKPTVYNFSKDAVAAIFSTQGDNGAGEPDRPPQQVLLDEPYFFGGTFAADATVTGKTAIQLQGCAHFVVSRPWFEAVGFGLRTIAGTGPTFINNNKGRMYAPRRGGIDIPEMDLASTIEGIFEWDYPVTLSANSIKNKIFSQGPVSQITDASGDNDVWAQDSIRLSKTTQKLNAVTDGLFSESLTIADDTAVSVVPPNATGLILIQETSDSTVNAIIHFRAASGGYTLGMVLGANTETSTSVLAGTTGVDGKFTVSANVDGSLYFENRRNGTRTAVITFVSTTYA